MARCLKGLLILLAALAILATGIVAQGIAKERNKPKLILQITVDQLRGDLLARYYDRFGEGGFRYLLDAGTVYSNAHHRHPLENRLRKWLLRRKRCPPFRARWHRRFHHQGRK